MTRIMAMIVAALLVIVSTATASNNTRDGAGKTLGIFSVVKFPNDACTGSTTYNGTCYTAEECNSKSGTAAGSCASGFGVCCTFSLGCGSSTSENRTYHAITSFSSSTDASPCTYQVCPSTSSVCKLRIDFTAFSIYTPWTSLVIAAGTSGYIPNGIVVNILDGVILGDCLVDQFTVTGAGVSSPPTMCGIGGAQHMYVPASPSCNNINFNIDTDVTYTRTWAFTVQQIECSTDYGKHSCMQYYTGTSGTFNSWNFDTTLTTIAPAATNHHLNSQQYDICFRQERGYCRVCFSPVITTAASSSFGVSASATGPALQSGAGDAVCTGVTVYADYIEVGNLVAPTITTSLTGGLTKFCGAIFSSATGATATASACTYKTPFVWGVHFDDEEVAIAACTGTVLETCENHVAGGGGIGFNMQWWLESC